MKQDKIRISTDEQFRIVIIYMYITHSILQWVYYNWFISTNSMNFLHKHKASLRSTYCMMRKAFQLERPFIESMRNKINWEIRRLLYVFDCVLSFNLNCASFHNKNTSLSYLICKKNISLSLRKKMAPKII